MNDIFGWPFDTTGFVPRRACGDWSPVLMWTHVVSDVVIWLAYVSIPVVLIWFTRLKGVPFPRVFVLFAAFILACGCVHLVEAAIFFEPLYRLSGLLKFVTAGVSVATVIALVPVVRRLSGVDFGKFTPPAAPVREVSAWVTVVFVVAVIVLVGNTVISDHNLGVMTANDRWVTHTREVKQELTEIAADLADAETGHRGYLLTGRESYLAPFRDGRASVDRRLDRLDRLVADNPAQAEEAAKLRKLAAAKMGEMDRVLAVFRADGTDAARDRVLAGNGKQLMDDIRATIAGMSATEDALLDRRAAAARDTHRATTVTNLFGGVLAFGVIGLGYGIIRWEFGRRRAAEVALSESERTLRAFYESAPICMGVVEPTANGDIWHVYDNAAACAFFGVEPGGTAGRLGSELGADARTLAEWRAKYAESAAARGPVRFDYRFDAPDATVSDGRASSPDVKTAARWLSVTVAPLGVGPAGGPRFCYVAEDVTGRLQAAAALRESEEKFRTITESIPQLAWMTEPDGSITWYNRRWFEYTGKTFDEMKGWGWQAVHDPAELPRVKAKFAAHIASGEAWEDTFPLRRHDGAMRWFLSQARPIRDPDGNVVRWFGTNTDVTDRREYEMALAERGRLAALRASVGQDLTVGGATQPVLQRVAETILDQLGVALVRVWTIDDADGTLALQATAGMNTDGDGPPARIPVGQYKIGRIAASGQPHLTNDLPHDPNATDPDWVAREHLVAFAGYPLRTGDGVRGVIALYSRTRLSPGLLADLGPLTETIAVYLERHRAEDRVRASAARFRTLTEAVPLIVWTADPGGNVTFYNRRWQEYTGRTLAERPPGGWTDIVHPDDREAHYAAWAAAVAAGTDQFTAEVRVRRTDGAFRWMLTVAIPLRDDAGRVTEWVGTLTDIDDRKRQTDTLGVLVAERTAALRQANAALLDEIDDRKRAEEKVRAVAAELARSNGELEQFAYVASHDLQEPLRKIQAFGDRLVTKFKADLPDAGKDYVDRMLTSAARMRRLIDDLLTFSRVATQARSFAPVELTEIVTGVASDLDERTTSTGGRIEIFGRLPEVDADASQMRQLFQNLIANALKFQKPGVPPVVEVRAAAATLPGASPAAAPIPAWELTVADNGIGFDEKYLDRIFQVFQRLHGRAEYEGTGVGLAICRKIVERHGGTITARSQPGEGATFVVTLPAPPRTDSRARPGHEEADHDPGG